MATAKLETNDAGKTRVQITWEIEDFRAVYHESVTDEEIVQAMEDVVENYDWDEGVTADNHVYCAIERVLGEDEE